LHERGIIEGHHRGVSYKKYPESGMEMALPINIADLINKAGVFMDCPQVLSGSFAFFQNQ